jgi:transcriptional regulator of acetoin/glycerol metabolism
VYDEAILITVRWVQEAAVMFDMPQIDTLLPAWQHFQAAGRLDGAPVPPPVAHSWQRCAAHEVQWPLLGTTHESTEEARALLPIVRPMLEDVFQHIEGLGGILAFTDVRGVVVDGLGDRAAVQAAARVGCLPGALWSEEQRGTNAFALALIDAAPASVVGAGHFCAELHPFYASAAPIFDGLGLPIGAVGVLGRREGYHAHSLGMVAAAAQAITNQLQAHLWLGNTNEHLSELSAILQTLSEGVMLLTHAGVISRLNARAGQLLGLLPARATGRRLRDLMEIPPRLAHALAQHHELLDEEIVFQVHGNRTPCVCTLKIIAPAPAALSVVLAHLPGGTGLALTAAAPVGGCVLSLRPIARVQRLIHRMTGARARMTFADIVGTSAPLADALRLARIAATSTATVLLRGETGTGKDLFAQSIHTGSDRASGPFVAINCAAIPRELITSELFGYEGGAFTGADREGRPGKFELANGGTLFLDEIGDMPRDLQTSLLRALETRTITRIGGQQVISVDVRIIAATHKPLEAAVADGAFRADLFYRLNVFTIHVPSLRERAEDIPALLFLLLRRHSATLGHAITVAPDALAALMAYPWPGNIRELENTIERAVYVAEDATIRWRDLPHDVRAALPASAAPPALVTASASPAVPSLRQERAQSEADAIRRALEATDGNVTEAARLLGISRATLWRRRAKLAPEEGI